ncbi:MAG: hypothetical protein AB1762_13450, partial [Gemmatimonadota bacterium]
AQQPTRTWSLSARPAVSIGNRPDDTTSFELVVGATRLPDGRGRVGDLGAYALRLFSPEGKAIGSFARKGSGPGEITYLRFLLRCGDSLFTMDVQNGHRVDVRSLAGSRARTFRFGSPQGGNVPYESACNNNRIFAHYGWERMKTPLAGVYRPQVPFWLSGPDSAIGKLFGDLDGSERFGRVGKDPETGRPWASAGPLPFGKQPAIAIGRDRVYIGSANRYEVLVFDLEGKRLTSITKPNDGVATTRADIETAIDKAAAGRPDSVRARIAQSYATMPLPKTLPPYARFVVDADDLLWVQDFPRAQLRTVRWSVFDRTARAIAELALPTHLEVYEIGRDYVLGRYVDPEEAVPEVRLYRLSRR